jgi:hypothetical protein
MFFGRMTLNNPMWDEVYQKEMAVAEAMWNKTTEDVLEYMGRPVVRSRTLPYGARKVTQVPGGADLAESTDGNSFNFGGIIPFIMKDKHTGTSTVQPSGAVFRAGNNDRRTLFVSSFTAGLTPGDTLTQAVSGATMLITTPQLNRVDIATNALVRAHYARYNMVTGIDLHTGVWDTTNTVTSDNAGGVVMAPTPVTPVLISDGDELISNTDVVEAASVDYQPTDPDYEPIWVMRRGRTMAWVNGDTAGGGNGNGNIAIGTPLTWPDYNDVLVRAALNASDADNIIAVALQAATAATDELIPVYLFADCPIDYFVAGVATTPGEQGVEPQA